jgi:pimeloyl-ACP methyl ester carboxylesterase
VLGYGLETWPFAQEAVHKMAGMSSSEIFTIDGAAHGAHVSHPEQFANFVRRAVVLV